MKTAINWNAIDTVLLDMDGTILDLHFDNYFWLIYLPENFAIKHNISFESAFEKLSQQFNTLRGTLNWYCLDYWTDTLQMDIVGLKKNIQHKVAFRPQALAFLQFLKQQNKQVFLATNAHPRSLEIKQLNTRFHQYFDELITSHEFGAPKEQQSFWQQLQKKIEFDNSKTLFIDDSVAVLTSAQQFGIAYLLGIAQPDSQKPPQSMAPFDAIENFNDIMLSE
jgi:putative hydrolase of the HAD superfamily